MTLFHSKILVGVSATNKRVGDTQNFGMGRDKGNTAFTVTTLLSTSFSHFISTRTYVCKYAPFLLTAHMSPYWTRGRAVVKVEGHFKVELTFFQVLTRIGEHIIEF